MPHGLSSQWQIFSLWYDGTLESERENDIIWLLALVRGKIFTNFYIWFLSGARYLPISTFCFCQGARYLLISAFGSGQGVRYLPISAFGSSQGQYIYQLLLLTLVCRGTQGQQELFSKDLCFETN